MEYVSTDTMSAHYECKRSDTLTERFRNLSVVAAVQKLVFMAEVEFDVVSGNDLGEQKISLQHPACPASREFHELVFQAIKSCPLISSVSLRQDSLGLERYRYLL